MVAIPAPSRVLEDGARDLPTADEEAIFFASLHQSNGTTRMTSAGRLDDLNDHVTPLLIRRRTVYALDVGISSGVLTLDWMNAIQEAGLDCQMVAFDRALSARLVRFVHVQILAEERGHALLIHTGRRAFTRPTAAGDSLTNFSARVVFRSVDIVVRLLRAVGLGQSVRLLTRDIRGRGDVQLCEHDVFADAPAWIGRFDVVRVANLLNRAYFTDDKLRAGIRNVASWVREGGIVAVVRTDLDGRNHATIFRKEQGALQALQRLGSGSEIEVLINSECR